jgi:hypothetical protein
MARGRARRVPGRPLGEGAPDWLSAQHLHSAAFFAARGAPARVPPPRAWQAAGARQVLEGQADGEGAPPGWRRRGAPKGMLGGPRRGLGLGGGIGQESKCLGCAPGGGGRCRGAAWARAGVAAGESSGAARHGVGCLGKMLGLGYKWRPRRARRAGQGSQRVGFFGLVSRGPQRGGAEVRGWPRPGRGGGPRVQAWRPRGRGGPGPRGVAAPRQVLAQGMKTGARGARHAAAAARSGRPARGTGGAGPKTSAPRLGRGAAGARPGARPWPARARKGEGGSRPLGRAPGRRGAARPPAAERFGARRRAARRRSRAAARRRGGGPREIWACAGENPTRASARRAAAPAWPCARTPGRGARARRPAPPGVGVAGGGA